MDTSFASLTLVFVAALLTALATGLGALPFAFLDFRRLGWLGLANAIAAGVMLGASISLLVEAGEASVPRMVIGALVGVAFIYAVQAVLHHTGHHDVTQLAASQTRKGLLIVAVMTAHSTAEGFGVGSSFADSGKFGLVIAIAIAVHNIPEGLAISLVLVPRGATVWAAAGWSIFSSLPQPLLALPSFLFVEAFDAMLPAALGFAAGAMIWMLGRELLPEAVNHAPKRQVFAIVALTAGAMFTFQFFLIG
jgi:ZIP family zinc transporter